MNALYVHLIKMIGYISKLFLLYPFFAYKESSIYSLLDKKFRKLLCIYICNLFCPFHSFNFIFW